MLFKGKYDTTIETKALKAWNKRPGTWVVEEFCIERGYGRETLLGIAKADEEFAEALSLANTKRIATLIKEGCTGNMKGDMCKFVLTAMHQINGNSESTHYTYVVGKLPELLDE